MSKITSKQNELKYDLNSVKGWLAVSVLIHHFFLLFEPLLFDKLGSHSFYSLFETFFCGLGNYAVLCFYSLTGIGIRLSILKDTKNTFSKKVIKRYITLMYPILLLNIISYVLMSFNLYIANHTLSPYVSSWATNHNDFTPVLFDAVKIAIFDMWFPGSKNPYFSFTWCMSYFLVGAIILYFIADYYKTNQKLWVLLLSSILILIINPDFLAFVLGFLFMDLVHRLENLEVKNKIAEMLYKLRVIILLFITFSSVILGIFNNDKLVKQFFAVTFSISTVIISTAANSIKSHLHITNMLSKISWEIFLTQYFVLFTFSCHLFNFLYNHSVNLLFNMFFTTASTTIIVLAVSKVFSYLIKYINSSINKIFS